MIIEVYLFNVMGHRFPICSLLMIVYYFVELRNQSAR